MDPDLALVLGLAVTILSIPAFLSAFADRRAPRAPIATILIGGALILYAVIVQPGDYALNQLPDVVVGVIARYLP